MNAGEGTWGGLTPWTIRERFTIGTVDGPPPYQFARLAALDVDSDGNVYVLDSGHRRVRKYDRAGRYVTEMGGDGGGPGEFQRPPHGLLFELGGMTLIGDSIVAVHDPWSWTLVRFLRDGAFLDEIGLEVPPPDLVFARRSLQLVDLGGGWLLMHHTYPFGVGAASSPSDGQHVLVRVTSDGSQFDTLITYRQDDIVHRTLDERHAEFFPRPFAARWHWAVGPEGRIAFGHGATYDIAVYDRSGEPLVRFTRTVDAASVTAQHIAAFRRAFPFGDGMDTLLPPVRRAAASLLQDLEFPVHWPMFDDIEYDGIGRIWVRRHPLPDDSASQWDVFGTDLTYLGFVDLLLDLAVLKITFGRIFGRVRDENGVDFLRVYEIVGAAHAAGTLTGPRSRAVSRPDR